MNMKRKLILTALLTPFFIASWSYATDLPNEIVLNYSGPYGIPATMKFTHNDHNYTIDTTVAIPFNKMQFSIKGKIQNNQLLPTEYIVYRSGKAYSSALIDYNKKTIDLAARLLFAPSELPVGVITALLGAPFFILILIKDKKN